MKKDWYASKTVWGLIVALAAYILGYTEIMAAGLALAGIGYRDAMK